MFATTMMCLLKKTNPTFDYERGNEVEMTGSPGPTAVSCGQTTLKYWVPW